jgi:hypothetical protein
VHSGVQQADRLPEDRHWMLLARCEEDFALISSLRWLAALARIGTQKVPQTSSSL